MDGEDKNLVWFCVILQSAAAVIFAIKAARWGISLVKPENLLGSAVTAAVFAAGGMLCSIAAGPILATKLWTGFCDAFPHFYTAYVPAFIKEIYRSLGKIWITITEGDTWLAPIANILGGFIFFGVCIAILGALYCASLAPAIAICENSGYILDTLFGAQRKDEETVPTAVTNSGGSDNLLETQQIPKRDLAAFDGLVGVDSAIEAIKDALELPLLYPEKIKEYGITPPKGLLLCGPPGTGKTSLARATAAYFGCYFSCVKASELLGPYTGTSEQAVKKLFSTARVNRPAVIFFDEIDAICRRRDGAHMNRASDIILNILLAEMDGFERNDGLFIIGATNRADVLDEAVLRPGRFDTIIELKLPDTEARTKLFWRLLRDKPFAKGENIDLLKLAKQTEGMSPAQIESICRKAAITALKREINNGDTGIRMQDILSAVEEERATR